MSVTEQTYWTEEKVSNLLDYLEQITSKLEQQSIYYQRINDEHEYMQTDEYKVEQSAIQKEQSDLLAKEKEATLKLEDERHKELVDSLENVATVAGDETTSTTLIESFNGFTDTYDKNVSEFNEMLWVVFLSFLFITAFKSLGNQIWRV